MTEKTHSKNVLVFVRVPELGRVKTRLAGKLSQESVLRLYRRFVEDILDTLSTREYALVICYDPPEGRLKMVSWLGSGYNLMPQRGATLGERMENALTDVFSRGVDQAILIGSDFPDLPAAIIDEAFQGLETRNLVVGPAIDGGYYLIGFNAGSFLPEIFHGLPWGTQFVFENTAVLAEKNNLRMYILPEWQDIDTYDDLKAFFFRAKKKGLRQLKTMQYLEQIRNLNPTILQEENH